MPIGRVTEPASPFRRRAAVINKKLSYRLETGRQQRISL